jgi:hypothetical protein
MMWVALLVVGIAVTFMKLGVLSVWVKVLAGAAAAFAVLAVLLLLALLGHRRRI